MRKVVVAIEGIHGCGKSTFIDKLEKAGRTVIDEGFMNNSMHKYSPKSIARQTVWLASWIERVTKATENAQHEDYMPIYIDRSMYSALMYNDNDDETRIMRQLIDRSEAEMQKQGIWIVKLVLTDKHEAAWLNIQQRLQLEPHRKKFNEHKREHYDAIWNKYYTENESLWDLKMVMPQSYPSDHVAIEHMDELVREYVSNKNLGDAIWC
jgi:thymidylate kinase